MFQASCNDRAKNPFLKNSNSAEGASRRPTVWTKHCLTAAGTFCHLKTGSPSLRLAPVVATRDQRLRSNGQSSRQTPVATTCPWTSTWFSLHVIILINRLKSLRSKYTERSSLLRFQWRVVLFFKMWDMWIVDYCTTMLQKEGLAPSSFCLVSSLTSWWCLPTPRENPCSQSGWTLLSATERKASF